MFRLKQWYKKLVDKFSYKRRYLRLLEEHTELQGQWEELREKCNSAATKYKKLEQERNKISKQYTDLLNEFRALQAENIILKNSNEVAGQINTQLVQEMSTFSAQKQISPE